MFCPSCGFKPIPEQATVCPKCKCTLDAEAWSVYRPASMRLRFLAALIDHILIGFLASGATQWALAYIHTHKHLRPHQTLLIGVLQTSLLLIVFVLVTSIFSTTPGKSLLGLKIIHAKDGRPISFWQVVWREGIGRFLCMLFLPVGYVTAGLKHYRFRTVADMLAKTVVVKKRSPHAPH